MPVSAPPTVPQRPMIDGTKQNDEEKTKHRTGPFLFRSLTDVRHSSQDASG